MSLIDLNHHAVVAPHWVTHATELLVSGFNRAALLFLRLTLAAITATARWCRNRQATYSLGRADPAMLRDLGIARSGIESAVRHGR